MSSTQPSRSVAGGRRIVAALIFFAGGVLIAVVLRRFPEDLERTLPAAVAALVGAVVTGLTAAGVRVRASAGLRTIALGMTLILTLATFATSEYYAGVTLQPSNTQSIEARQRIVQVIEGQRLLTGMLAYALLGLGVSMHAASRAPRNLDS